MHLKKRETVYCRIRPEIVCGLLCVLLLLLAAAAGEGYCIWKLKEPGVPDREGQMRVEVIYDGWESVLADAGACFLCGEHVRSRISYFQGLDSIGLLSLKDWTIVDFLLSAEEGDSNPGERYGNMGGVTYLCSGDPSRGMARVHVTLPEDWQMEEGFLRQNLCQPCLDQVADALSTWKWEREEKDAFPLCLVDFQTLDLYPVQDWCAGYFIRDYWVELDFEESSMWIKAYYVPKRER